MFSESQKVTSLCTEQLPRQHVCVQCSFEMQLSMHKVVISVRGDILFLTDQGRSISTDILGSTRAICTLE